MALREGAALDVLAREAHGDPVDEQRRVCERLGLAPIDAAVVEGPTAAVELPRELGVHGEVLRDAQQLLVERAQAVLGDGGDDAAAGAVGNALVLRLCGNARA